MADEPRIRDRFTTGGYLNIEQRLEDAIAPPPPPADVYGLSASLTPSLVLLGASALVAFQATKNGLPVPDPFISVFVDDPAIVDVPGQVVAGADGRASFNVISKAPGVAAIRGAFATDGVLIYSLPVTLTVQETPLQANYGMSGWGQVVMTLETPLANALVPQPERMSHQEQLRLYGNDLGLEYAAGLENQTVVFLPKWLLE